MDSGGSVADFSGESTGMDSLTGVGTTDVDSECGILTTFSTSVEGDAGLVDCFEGGSQVDASVSGAGDVVPVTVSVLLVVVPLAGGALQDTGTTGVPVPETVFTGVSVPISTGAAEANSGETFGAVTLVEDRGVSTADELVGAAGASDMVGPGVESVCGGLTAEGRAGSFWVTVGAQVRVAEEEMDAWSTEVVSALTSAAQDI